MFHNIRILSERHRVHVLSFTGSPEEQDWLNSLKPVCESVRGIGRIPDFRPHWLSLKPFLVREFSTPEMHKAVDETVRARKIQIVQCEYLQMSQFRRKRVFSVLTAHEVLSRNAREAFETASDPVEKLRLFYRWMQILRYEVRQVNQFDRVITMTEEDAAYLRSYAPEANVRAIPIGIDADEFRPAPTPAGGSVSIVFVGNFLHNPNVEAAQFLITELAPRFPREEFIIAGSPIPRDLPAAPNVVFPGYIPDTRVLYQGSNTIVAAPLFSGSGQRVKLLEAFAMGCPVVTTSVGAAGFRVQNGVHAFLAETGEEFEAAVRRLIADPALRKRAGENARALILDRFTWSLIGKELQNVVEEAAVSH
jgi:glycosyltransferase involved in cell wall biosynthesis